jgi:phosphoglycolate phosphatase
MMAESPSRRRARGWLFDLDGTLLDTAPDFAHALNLLRAEDARVPLTIGDIRAHVSHGAGALISAAFPDCADVARKEVRRTRLVALYAAAAGHYSALFGGIEVVLERLTARRIPWGVVTNKPGWLTAPLLAKTGLATRVHCVVAGDSTPYAKPDPTPLLTAAAALGCAADESIYVGDAERDVAAARAAGMRALIAVYGYVGADDEPASWGAEALVHTPLDLLAWV